jgi:hypothetical protein
MTHQGKGWNIEREVEMFHQLVLDVSPAFRPFQREGTP